MTNIIDMTDDEWLEYCIGVWSETKVCPECGSGIWKNDAGDEWCDKCNWANSQELVDLAEWLGKNRCP